MAALIIPHPGEKVITITCRYCDYEVKVTAEPGEIEGRITVHTCDCYTDSYLHIRYLHPLEVEKPTWTRPLRKKGTLHEHHC